jgi:ABC-2 type transport system ATP-binding protein
MPMNPNEPMILVDQLTKKYGERAVVDHVSFDIGHSEFFSMLGPNGAGKTTTIRMLTTVSSITEGKASIAGKDVKTDAAAVRDVIGILPQEVTLDNELKGIENLLLAAKLHHMDDRLAKDRSRDLLKLVELENFADKRVGTYSGGMKRRLQLITALIHKPQILFLDEPTVGLDVQTRTKIWDYLQRLNREEDLTIFMTTHYLEEADYLSDRIAIMDHGLIKVSGSPSQLKQSLHGDVLAIEVSQGSDLTDLLSEIEDITEVSRVGDIYRMKVSNVEEVLPSVVTGIASKGLKIRKTSFNEPTMDDVFLEIIGRSMRDAQEEATVHKSEVKEKRGDKK